MNANSSEHGTEGASRRSFIGVTVGSIVMLPTVANAMLLPAEAALAEAGEFAEQAEQESIEYIPQRRVRYTLTMDGDTTEVTYAGTYSKADVTVMGSPVKPDDEGGSGGGASTKASSGKSGLPSTGDVLSVAALALAGAAGAVAHRALRSREGSEDDEA